eukprot:1461169-Pyramimonas_sp.AAC.1
MSSRRRLTSSLAAWPTRTPSCERPLLRSSAWSSRPAPPCREPSRPRARSHRRLRTCCPPS